MTVENYKFFAAGEKVRFLNQDGSVHDTGKVINHVPNAEGRILVRWSSGAQTWTRLERLERRQ